MITRTALISIIGPAALLVFGYIGWMQFAANKVDSAYFGLRAEEISLTPRPAWIQSDIVQEVFEGSKLNEVSRLNHQACATVARAFDLHPWVRRTIRVKKLSDSIAVDVEYRKPVAMVAVLTEENSRQPSGYYPIDSEGVLLPTGDFSADSAIQDYFLIYTLNTNLNSNTVGSVFGDARILEAAKLCELLEPLKEPLSLERIYVYQDAQMSGRSRWIFELSSQSKNALPAEKYVWGHAPGAEVGGELEATEKIKSLLDYRARQNGTLTTVPNNPPPPNFLNGTNLYE